MVDRFDFETNLMSLDLISSELNTVIDGVLEYDMTPDEVSNALLGINALHNVRFEQVMACFENMIPQMDRKSAYVPVRRTVYESGPTNELIDILLSMRGELSILAPKGRELEVTRVIELLDNIADYSGDSGDVFGDL